MIEPILFPYLTMPVRLEYGDKKDKTICWFACDEHLQKYLTKYKLDKRKIKVDYKDGEPNKSNKKHKTKVQQATGKNSNGSSGRNRRSTKDLDSSGVIDRTGKSKK